MDTEAQSDELMALSSIFDKDVFQRRSLRDRNCHAGQFRFLLVDRPSSSDVQITGHESDGTEWDFTVQFVPPATLFFCLPPDYPSSSPPKYMFGAPWLSQTRVREIRKKLAKSWKDNMGMPILFLWYQLIEETLLEYLQDRIDLSNIAATTASQSHVHETHSPDKSARSHSESSNSSCSADLGANCSPPSGSHRAIDSPDSSAVGSFNDDSVATTTSPTPKPTDSLFALNRSYTMDQLVTLLRDYNEHMHRVRFEENAFGCLVCCVTKSGKDCIKFEPCHHVFCKCCVSEYYEMLILEGNLQSLKCLANECESVPSTYQVASLVSEEMFVRYDSLLLSRTLDDMKDVVICPRPMCQVPVLLDNVGDTMGTCSACNFTFCCLCRKTYHGLAGCSLDAVDKHGVLKDYRSADGNTKQELEQRYGKSNLKRLLDDAMANEWIHDNAKRCPSCNIGIQKFDGCNKMTCWKCRAYFCWLCLRPLHHNDPYGHFNNPQSPCFNKLFQGLTEEEIQRLMIQEEDDDDDFFGVLNVRRFR